MIQRYCLGFLICAGEVVLIKKLRPSWQAGRLNGVGGHIEKGELPIQAMVREFREETGASVTSWSKFVVLKGRGYELHCFRAEGYREIFSMTDEKVCWYSVASVVHDSKLIENLTWLIPMAAYSHRIHGTIRHEDPYA